MAYNHETLGLHFRCVNFMTSIANSVTRVTAEYFYIYFLGEMILLKSIMILGMLARLQQAPFITTYYHYIP